MKQDSTNANVKRYYESQTLSSAKLAHLLEMHEQHQADGKQSVSSEQQKPSKLNDFLRKHIAIAASIFVAFIIGTQMFTFLDSEDATLIDRVTKEILLNHQKQFDVEFSNESIPGLRTEMQKLDFNLILNDFINKTKLQIIGARYCSIQGEIAAQIKLQDSDGNRYTLYQTALNEKLKTLKDTTQVVNGLIVETWNEQGVFLGLAGASSVK